MAFNYAENRFEILSISDLIVSSKIMVLGKTFASAI
jgi:hypothetical protein